MVKKTINRHGVFKRLYTMMTPEEWIDKHKEHAGEILAFESNNMKFMKCQRCDQMFVTECDFEYEDKWPEIESINP